MKKKSSSRQWGQIGDRIIIRNGRPITEKKSIEIQGKILSILEGMTHANALAILEMTKISISEGSTIQSFH